MTSLWETCAAPAREITGNLRAREGHVPIAALARGSILGGRVGELCGRSVMLATHEQLSSGLALLELDGVARRLVLCTPDLDPEQLAVAAATAEADAVLCDPASDDAVTAPLLPSIEHFTATVNPIAPLAAARGAADGGLATEWILLTSGTTGQPKLVQHDVSSLSGALPRRESRGKPMVWSTFYDIRRYGGLQIYLRAVLSGSDIVLSSAGESVREFLTRAASAGVTHMSGTPSHWRRALMSGDAGLIEPEYVRLSGEVADQTVLDSLRAAYPNARVAHAFASTEAGVAFDVNDGLAGFPESYLAGADGAIRMKIEAGTLWIRSARTAARYLGIDATLASADGFVDTGDIVELVAGRYYFRGRKGGIINVGGLKVHPEEVESVLNADPRVRMSRVTARRNPITGALIVAEVVLKQPQDASGASGASEVRQELLQACRRALAAHKVPATMHFVLSLELTAAGKLVRPGA